MLEIAQILFKPKLPSNSNSVGRKFKILEKKI